MKTLPQSFSAIIKLAKHIARKATSRKLAGRDGAASNATEHTALTEMAITKELNTLRHIGRCSLLVTWVIALACQIDRFLQALTIPGMAAVVAVSAVTAAISVFTHSRSIRLSRKTPSPRQ